MNWKFWEWEIWKEDEFAPHPLPMLEDPVETPPKNPEADRIRQQLLANRK